MSQLESTPPNEESPPPTGKERLPHSIYGILSFALAILAIVAIFALCCITVYIVHKYPYDTGSEPPPVEHILVGFGFILTFFTQLAALIFGIIGVCQTHTQKVFAICGIVISSVFLIPITALLIDTFISVPLEL